MDVTGGPNGRTWWSTVVMTILVAVDGGRDDIDGGGR